ncbi:translocation/assembly module TamB domain-containing protein [Idiomarina sp. M1R2S28]|uniref:Translocation/assembly module TamB domain-containing protein n=1 Tax=Idiomarina rhizosphaerae TaxID=2961572 RepID=A0A9X2FZ36_9GAMM|nr:translocation/assembly module TamB domain-containing protein [Idiomarina rhizosphaerae]MCP1340625.1 translocation/assembly module TamB domain-containing protein [Idiomarina rhizosphaerae]
MSIYRWLASIFLVLVVLIPLLAISLVGSETGSRWVLTQGQKYLPVDIQYKAFHGTLINEFEFEDFHFESETFSYTPDKLVINWDPLALLSGVIRIDNIESLGGEIRLRAAQNSSQNADSEASVEDIQIELPLDVNLRNLLVKESRFFILENPSQELTIEASARVNTDGQLNIRQLRLEHQYLTTEISGKTKLSYPFKSELENNTHLHSPDFPSLKVKTDITGDIQSLTTNSELSEGLVGEITAKINTPLKELSWQFDSNWQKNNLSQWLASAGVDQIELSFAGDIRGEGGLTQASIEPDITVTVNQQTMDIDGAVSYQDNIINFAPLNVHSKGDIKGQLALQGDISSLSTTPVIDASVSWEELIYQPNGISSREGKLQAQGELDELSINLNNKLSGLLEENIKLVTEAKLNPDSLSVLSLKLTHNDETVSGKADINWKDNLSLTTDISGEYQQRAVNAKVELRLSEPYLFVDQFNASWGTQSLIAEGALSPGKKLSWQITSKDLSELSDVKGEVVATGDISGQLNQPEFELGVNKFNFKHPEYNAVSLNQPITAGFNYEDVTFNTTPVCLSYEGIDNPFCLKLEQQDKVISFDANASEVPLGILQALVLPNVAYKLTGEVSAEVTGAFDYQNMTLRKLDGVINADNSQVLAGEEKVTLNQLNLTAKNRDDEGIDIGMTAVADELAFNLSGQLTIEEIAPDSPISGKVSLNSNSLELLSLFSPQVDIGDGSTSAELDIAGNLNDPTASGKVNLNADRIIVLASGTLISELNAELTADANVGEFTVNANGKIGEGDVTIEGELNAFKRTGDLIIKGKDLLILDTPDLLLVASPDISLKLDKDLVFVRGDLHLPKARITPVNLDQAVTESADVTLKNESKEPPLFSTNTDITVSLGEQVRVEALGFSGNLKGKLQITQQPDSVARGNGSIGVVSGNYEIYGQKLAIERGDLLFNGGPLDTPSLNLRVTRNIEKTGIDERPPEKIGARVTGTINRPELSLFSTPPLPDSTILSYLLFGKPPGSQGDANNLELQAALLVGGRSAKFLTEGIKDTFDLDEVSLDSETSDINDTSLYIGKYLSPRLYVKYGIGLLEPTSTFILRYTLSERLLFESTSTTEGQGGDLIYTIEN